MGGTLMSAGGQLLRHWGKDMGLSLSAMDKIDMIFLLSAFKLIWAGILTWSFSFLGCKGRRAWLILMLSIALLSLILLRELPFFGPLFLMTLVIFTFAFTSYDMMIVASQMDALEKPYWGLGENFVITAYRVGMSMTSVGLILSHEQWSWPQIYLLIIGFISFGFLCIWKLPQFDFLNHTPINRHKSLASLWEPFKVWFIQPGAGLVAIFMIICKFSDGLINSQRDFFLLVHGLTKTDLAIVKNVGLWIGVAAGFGSGFFIRYRGILTSLRMGYLSQLVAIGGLWVANQMNLKGIFLVIPILLQYATRGFCMISLYCFQLNCCQLQWALGQLALITMLTDFGLHIASARSGWVVDHLGYSWLWGLSCLFNVPVLILISKVTRIPFIRDNIALRKSSSPQDEA